MKQNYVTMTKTICGTKVKHISLLILKISFLIIFGCGVKIQSCPRDSKYVSYVDVGFA